MYIFAQSTRPVKIACAPLHRWNNHTCTSTLIDAELAKDPDAPAFTSRTSHHPRHQSPPDGHPHALDLGDAACDAVLIPVGGGGLIAGMATVLKALRPEIEVIGVEPAECASLTAALAAGKPVEVPFTGTLADGLAVPTMGSNAYEICTAPALPSYCLTCVQGW